MNRKLTLTYEIPEDICLVLEQKAAVEGRRMEDVVAEHVAHCQARRTNLAPQEIERRVVAFERHFGVWDSGDSQSSDNERIDADLAGEYDGHVG